MTSPLAAKSSKSSFHQEPAAMNSDEAHQDVIEQESSAVVLENKDQEDVSDNDAAVDAAERASSPACDPTSSPDLPFDKYHDAMSQAEVSCPCKEHHGKVMVNQLFPLNMNYLFECIFGNTPFCARYWESRKDNRVGKWTTPSGDADSSGPLRIRRLNYRVDLAIKAIRNIEDQKILYYKPEQCLVVESESTTLGAPYADHFKVITRFCMTRCSPESTWVAIHSHIKFVKKPNFIVKGFIERNAMNSLVESFEFLKANLPKVNRIPLSQVSPVISAMADAEGDSRSVNHYNTSSKSSAPDETRESTMQENSAATSASSSPSSSAHPPSTQLKRRIRKHSTAMGGASRMSSNENEDRESNASTSSQVSHHRQEKDEPREAVSSYQQQYHHHHPRSQFTSYETQIRPLRRSTSVEKMDFVNMLFRLFIAAMFCLMVINGVLYFKLKRIESIADSLRSDPSDLISKISATSQAFQKELGHLVSTSLDSFEKIVDTLHQLDKKLNKNKDLSRDDPK